MSKFIIHSSSFIIAFLPLRSNELFDAFRLVSAMGRHTTVKVGNLPLGKAILFCAEVMHRPNVDGVTAMRVSLKVLDEVIEVIEDLPFRCTRSTIEPMFDDYAPSVFKYVADGLQVGGTVDFVTINAPVVLGRAPS